MRTAVWLIPAVLSAAAAWLLPGAYRALPFMSPDSATYIAWEPMRPVAYPALLSVIGLLSPSFSLLGPFQLAVFLATATWLAVTVSRTVAPSWIAWGFAAGIVLHPQVVSYAFTVLPESLLASVVMVNVVCAIHLFKDPRPLWAFASGGTLALAILLKPAAIAFAAGGLVIAVYSWQHANRLRLLGTWAATLGLPILAASTANMMRSGEFSPQSMGGYALLGVTGTFMPDTTPVSPPALRSDLLQQVGDIRDDLERLDALDLYYIYSSIAYHPVCDRSRDVILEHLRQADASATPRQLFVRMNSVAQTVARETIAQAPDRYFRHAAAHLYGLWLMPLVQNAASRQAFEARLAQARIDAPHLANEPVMARFVPQPAYWAFKAVLVAALASSLVAFLMWLSGPWSLAWTIAAYTSVLLHAYFLLTAMAQTGLPRYALTAWPLTLLVTTAAVGAAWQQWVKGRD